MGKVAGEGGEALEVLERRLVEAAVTDQMDETVVTGLRVGPEKSPSPTIRRPNHSSLRSTSRTRVVLPRY